VWEPTRLRGEDIDLIVNRLAGLDFASEDAYLVVDDRQYLRGAAQSFRVQQPYPCAFESADGPGKFGRHRA
jgi:hypothetical protein